MSNKKSNAIFLVQLSIIAISLKKLLLNFIGLVKHLPEANSWIANNSEHLGLLFFIPHWALLRFLPISYKSSHKLLHWLGRPPTSIYVYQVLVCGVLDTIRWLLLLKLEKLLWTIQVLTFKFMAWNHQFSVQYGAFDQDFCYDFWSLFWLQSTVYM